MDDLILENCLFKFFFRKEEEPYDLITSEEVQALLQEPVPDPDKEMAPLVTINKCILCVDFRKEEEPYDLITSEEVQASLQEPVPDPDTEMAPLLTSQSFAESGTVEGPSELWIRPGRAYATAVRIEEAGTTLKWEFTTYPKVSREEI